MVLAVHAVVAAGGQYVPVDVTAPPQRAAHILDTARPALILAASAAFAADTPSTLDKILAAKKIVIGMDLHGILKSCKNAPARPFGRTKDTEYKL